MNDILEYDGNTLDPPFRSRFQAKAVHSVSPVSPALNVLMEIKAALTAAEKVGLEGLPQRMFRKSEWPCELHVAHRLVSTFPDIDTRFLVGCIYPFFAMPWFDALHKQLLIEIFIRLGVLPRNALRADSLLDRSDSIDKDPLTGRRRTYREQRDEVLRREDEGMGALHAATRNTWLGEQYSAKCGYVLDNGVLVGKASSVPVQSRGSYHREYVSMPYHEEMLTQMLLMNACGLNMCVIGKRGCGKSVLVKQFANLVNKNLLYFPLYKDMSAHDLLQKRSTQANGDTIWMPSPLMTACLNGGIVVLDGLEQVPASTLSTLQSLMHGSKFMPLPDGTRLVNATPESSETDPLMDPVRPLQVHPECRIIGVARPQPSNQVSQQTWLTPEVNLAFMPFLILRPLDEVEELKVIETLSDNKVPGTASKVLELSRRLRSRVDDEGRSIAASLTTRQLLRICKRVTASPVDDVASVIKSACLWRFMPSLAQSVLMEEMLASGIVQLNTESISKRNKRNSVKVEVFNQVGAHSISSSIRRDRPVIGTLTIGDVVANIHQPSSPELVPQLVFFENPKQSGKWIKSECPS